MKNGKYWPFIIVGAIILNMIAAIYTVVISLDFYPEPDKSYFRNYQEVEKNYHLIKAEQEEFEKYFLIQPALKSEILNISKKEAFVFENEIILNIKELKDLKTKDLNYKAIIVRPHTNEEYKISFSKYDKKFTANFTPESDGRYTLLIEFMVNDLKSFYKFELCKNKCSK